MTDVRFCKVRFEKPPLAPERRSREGPYSPPGAALGAGRFIPRRGRLGPSWRGLGPSGGGRRATVEDSVGQQAALTSCQPGSDTPGSPVGLWAGDRPPSIQVRTIIPPQVHRPGQSGDPLLRQAGSWLLVNPDVINVHRGRRRRRTIGVANNTANIEIQ